VVADGVAGGHDLRPEFRIGAHGVAEGKERGWDARRLQDAEYCPGVCRIGPIVEGECDHRLVPRARADDLQTLGCRCIGLGEAEENQERQHEREMNADSRGYLPRVSGQRHTLRTPRRARMLN